MPALNSTAKETKDSEEFFKSVAKLITILLDKIISLENEKIDIFQNHMFSPYVAYNYIDFYGQGYITKLDFENLLKSNQIPYTPNALTYLLFVRSQKTSFTQAKAPTSRTDVLGYDEFLNIIRPKNS